MKHHEEVWSTLQTNNQQTITFESRDVRSTRSSPLHTPTAPQHSPVQEKRDDVKRLFDNETPDPVSTDGAKRGPYIITTFFSPTDAPTSPSKRPPDPQWIDKLVELIAEEF